MEIDHKRRRLSELTIYHPKIADHFGGRQKLSVAQLVTKPDVSPPYVVLFHTKLKGHGFPFALPCNVVLAVMEHAHPIALIRPTCHEESDDVHLSTCFRYLVSNRHRNSSRSELQLVF